MSTFNKIFDDVYKILIKDEKLLRLLHYPPTDSKNPHPLDDSLPNIVVEHNTSSSLPPPPEYEKMWDIIEKHIETTSKSDDLEENRLCRIYLYAGRVRPTIGNYYTMKQEIIIDIFCHYTYEVDQRLSKLIGRLNKLLAHKRITGLGKIDVRGGYPMSAPKEYVAYRMIFEVGRSK